MLFFRHPLRKEVQSLLRPVFGATALGATLALAGPLGPQGPAAQLDASSRSAPLPTTARLREGTQIVDQLGTFKITGDRTTFHPVDGKYQLGGLPNLNLERIVAAIRDQPDELVWSVSGAITEYQGSNYVLITHSVVKATKSPPSIRPDHGDRSEDDGP